MTIEEYDRLSLELKEIIRLHQVPGPLIYRAREYLTLGDFGHYQTLADLFRKFTPPRDVDS
jgi:hypothetical protein